MAVDCTDRAWIEARIAKIKTQIEAYEEAIDALASGVQSYQLDTGQTRQLVSRANVTSLQETVTILFDRLSTLQARLGCARAQGRPAW